MTLGKIDHMDFIAADLEKAEEYLVKKLGFKPLRRMEHQDKSISSELTSPAGDFVLQIHQGDEKQLQEKREQALNQSLFFNHIAFKVDDINKAFKEIKSKGVSFKRDSLIFNPASGRTLANTVDEDGHFWIQLCDTN